jgi:hypothetical protein
MTDNTKKTRNRIGDLMKPMGVAMAHAKLIRQMINKTVEPVYATRLSAMFVAQRGILESTKVEQDLNELKEAIDVLTAGHNRNVVQFKRPA